MKKLLIIIVILSACSTQSGFITTIGVPIERLEREIEKL